MKLVPAGMFPVAVVIFGITKLWNVDISAKMMIEYDLGMTSLGLIPEVGYRVVKNVRVAAGYNLTKLNDRDLSGEGYSAHGPFIQLKFKFDENTFRSLSAVSKGAPR